MVADDSVLAIRVPWLAPHDHVRRRQSIAVDETVRNNTVAIELRDDAQGAAPDILLPQAAIDLLSNPTTLGVDHVVDVRSTIPRNACQIPESVVRERLQHRSVPSLVERPSIRVGVAHPVHLP